MSEYIPLVLPHMLALGEDSNGNPMPTSEDVALYLTGAAQALSNSAGSFVSGLADASNIDFSTVGDMPPFNASVFGAVLDVNGHLATRPTTDLNFQYLVDRINSLVVPVPPVTVFQYVDPRNTFNYLDPGYLTAYREEAYTWGFVDPGHTWSYTDPSYPYGLTDPGYTSAYTEGGASQTYMEPGFLSQLVEPHFTSALRDLSISKLYNDLLNGGYGIEPNDELALWSRERDREALLAQANINEVRRQAAATSFPMPQGSLYTAIEKARQEYMAKTSSVNRDIALRRSELYVQNRQFTFKTSLESDAQGIEIYKALQNWQLMSEDLRIKVYDAIQGRLFSVEGLRIELYNAIQNRAILTERQRADVYNAIQNRAVLTEGQKIELYNAVQNRSVLSKKQESDLYNAFYDRAVKAEQLRVELHNAVLNRGVQIEAQAKEIYNAIQNRSIVSEQQRIALYNMIENRALDAAKTTVGMALALFEAGIKTFDSQLKSIEDQIKAKVDAGQIQTQLYSTDVAQYAAYQNAIAVFARTLIEQNQILLTRDKTTYEAKVKIMEFRLKQLMTTVENMSNINRFGAEFFRTGLGVTLGGVQAQNVQTITP